eukprot:scaffold18690_cov39-Attheya_sp.AAC.2
MRYISRAFQTWSGFVNLTSTAKVTARMARGLSMYLSLFLGKGQKGSSLSILFDLHKNGTKGRDGRDGKRGSRAFKTWYGLVNPTITAKVTISTSSSASFKQRLLQLPTMAFFLVGNH